MKPRKASSIFYPSFHLNFVHVDGISNKLTDLPLSLVLNERVPVKGPAPGGSRQLVLDKRSGVREELDQRRGVQLLRNVDPTSIVLQILRDQRMLGNLVELIWHRTPVSRML